MQPHNAVGVQLSQVAVYQHHKAQLQSLAGSCCETPDPLRAFTVKLCDFGAALVNTGGPGAPAVGITPRGTSRFCSPQVMSGLLNRGVAPGLTTLWAPAVHPDIVRTCATSYDAYAADVWSFGVTLFALVAGREPFQAAGPQCAPFRSFVRFTQPEALGEEVMCPQSDVWHKDVDAPSPPSWCWPDCFSPALVHLLGGCLRVREGERFSMEEVAAHPWFKNPSWVPPCGATLMSQSSSGLLPSSMLGLSHGIPVSPAALPFGDTHHHSTDDILDSTEHCNVFGECDTPVVSLDYPVGVGVLAELQPIVRESAQGMQPLRLPPSNESTSGAAAAASSAVSSSTANPAASAAGAGGGSGRWGSSLSASAGMPSLDTAVSGREADWAGALPLQPVPPDCKLDAAAHSPRTKRSVVPASQSVQLQSYAQKALRPAGWQEHDTSVHM